MSGKAGKYPLQREIERTIRAMQNCGLEVGGVERTGPNTFRILTKGETKTDAFEEWKAREGAHAG